MNLCCEKCGRDLDETLFYRSRNPKHTTGRLPICKQCATKYLDNRDSKTYMWLLKELDVPYIPQKWQQFLDKAIQRHSDAEPMSVINRYLAFVNLSAYKSFRFADGEFISSQWRY